MIYHMTYMTYMAYVNHIYIYYSYYILCMYVCIYILYISIQYLVYDRWQIIHRCEQPYRILDLFAFYFWRFSRLQRPLPTAHSHIWVAVGAESPTLRLGEKNLDSYPICHNSLGCTVSPRCFWCFKNIFNFERLFNFFVCPLSTGLTNIISYFGLWRWVETTQHLLVATLRTWPKVCNNTQEAPFPWFHSIGPTGNGSKTQPRPNDASTTQRGKSLSVEQEFDGYCLKIGCLVSITYIYI